MTDRTIHLASWLWGLLMDAGLDALAKKLKSLGKEPTEEQLRGIVLEAIEQADEGLTKDALALAIRYLDGEVDGDELGLACCKAQGLI